MKAEIHHFHSPDVDPLEDFHPTRREDAGALIQMMANPAGEPGEESFQIVVGTAEYLAQLPADKYMMEVQEWDFSAIRAELLRRVDEARGDSWSEVAEQINEWAQWEFDAYRRS